MKVLEGIQEGLLQDVLGVLLVHQQAVAEAVQSRGVLVIERGVGSLVAKQGGAQ